MDSIKVLMNLITCRSSFLINLIKAYCRLWYRHQISMRASALTYNFILSLIPALAVCISIASVVFDLKKYNQDFKNFIIDNLAEGAGNSVTTYVDSFLSKVRFQTIGYVGFASLLFTAILLFSNIEDTINRIWLIRKSKKIWKRVLIYNLIMILGPVSVSLSLAVTALASKFFPHMMVKAHTGVILVNALVLTLTYKIFPNKKVYWWSSVTAGFVVALSIEIAKFGFGVYTAKAMFYNTVYGGLAVLPFFLIWIYVNWTIFLSGALLAFVLQHHRYYRR